MRALAVLLWVYFGLAYLLMPAWWRHHSRHPALVEVPKTTLTANGIAGDPLNVALVGTRHELMHALLAAGWCAADPTTFRTGAHITASVLRGRPYPEAPMSSLYLWKRRQDLSFERSVNNNPRRRHHVRFWRAEELDTEGRPLWLGAATFDRSVGISHLTGQVTHHIAADVDAERDVLFTDLQRSAQLFEQYRIRGLSPTRLGRNGGGDPYYTDGDIRVGVLVGTSPPLGDE